MRMPVCGALLLIFLVPVLAFVRPGQRLRTLAQRHTTVPEPSDIVADAAGGLLYLVSDNGVLHVCDSTGRTLRTATQRGTDFEGVELHNGVVYVSDETERRIYTYRAGDLAFLGAHALPWAGGRNAGFESICWNDKSKGFVMVSEKRPLVVQECDEQFRPGRQVSLQGIADVAGARYAAGAVWLLSDEDQTIYRCDPETYAIQARYRIPVLNPEGIAFHIPSGRILIAADDLQRIYAFAQPGR